MEKIYFRFEDRSREVGEIIERDPDLPAPLSERYPGIERILDQYRPDGSLSRRECVYSLEHGDHAKAGIQTTRRFIHTLRLIGPVERRDMIWIGALQAKHPNTYGSEIATRLMHQRLKSRYPDAALPDEELARRYWSGAPSASPKFEFVARSAQVLSTKPFLETPGM